MYDESVRARARALLAFGTSVNRTSEVLGVGRAAIRDWRDHPGRAGSPTCPAPARSSAACAALFGFFLGDGCLSTVRSVHSLRIACDATLPGIIADVETCIRSVHPERPSYRVSAPGCVQVLSYWKHWPCLFPQHGPGRKHERTLGMTDWQWTIVEEHPAAFLRGLFHSDGCRARNWATRMVAGQKKRYDYPRWQFTNHSPEIMGWCRDALDIVDVPWRQSTWKTLSVSTDAGVARLDELIGPKS